MAPSIFSLTQLQRHVLLSSGWAYILSVLLSCLMTMVGNRVSLANSKDEDLWKDSSTNETRKRLEYYRQHEWVPPNYRPNSWRGLSVIELYWRRYINLCSKYMNIRYG